MSVRSQPQPIADPRAVTLPTRPVVSPWLPRLTLIAVSAMLLSNLVAAILAAGYQLYYDGLIYPGVSVWGVDLSGMTVEEAAAALDGTFTYPQMTTLTFRDGDVIWPVSAAELGVHFDIERTVQSAYQVGRDPSMIASLRQQAQAWREGYDISPVLIYNQMSAEAHIDAIAQQINRPALDAAIAVQDLNVTTTPGQIGRQVDQRATLANLNAVIYQLRSGEVQVVVAEHEPEIMDASAAAETVRAILASDLEIFIEEPSPDDPGPWTADRSALAEMVVLSRVPDPDGSGQMYVVSLNEAQLRSFLNPKVQELAREPVNAKFVFNDQSGQIEPISPSSRGRQLDVSATIQLINQTVVTTNHQVPLVFTIHEPGAPDTAAGVDLGVRELVSQARTSYVGSGEGRRANIVAAASRFHGVMIAPGQQFSFNQYLGEVSPETGFSEALIIYNGRTIKGVGGGVCQVSTTAFQAAFHAGYPIEERWQHAYWVNYYNDGEGYGMDATVYEPLVDLKFTNDTPYWLLIETYVDLPNSTLTFRFYSTKDGRYVVKDGPYVSNPVPHGPALYEENPELQPGQRKQVDWAVDGFDVVVYRNVYRADGSILYQDTFRSSYIPWQAVYQVAPGHIPPGAEVAGGG